MLEIILLVLIICALIAAIWGREAAQNAFGCAARAFLTIIAVIVVGVVAIAIAIYATTPKTLFDNTLTLQPGSGTHQTFTINSNSTINVTLNGSADCQAAIVRSADLNSYLNGGSVPVYLQLSRWDTTKGVTLGPGSYDLDINNESTAPNSVSYQITYTGN